MVVGNYLSPIRRALIAACGALVVSVIPATATGALADDTHNAPYYLSLGDSLAQGVQPDASGNSVPTNHGYVNDLYALERQQVPDLQLAELGCPGETTTSMLYGGPFCSRYPGYSGTQLNQAVAFLHTHRVVLVTIDIGGNNVDGCVNASGVLDPTCVANGISAAAGDLRQILAALRQAARPNVRIVGMNYYDAFLAAWFQSPSLAAASEVVAVNKFNPVLDADYAAFGVPVADVQDAFQTTNFTPLPNGVPTNVAAICTLTWMCAPHPVGPNIHANNMGYAVIASTFAPVVGRLQPRGH